MAAKKIVVIDDEPNIVKMITSRLNAKGYTTFAASNGREGLAVVKKEMPDAVILDVVMPEMDGFTFFKTMKKAADIANIPIVVLTARSAMRDTFEAMGVTEFLPKPFEGEVLLAKVEGLFRKRLLVLSDDANFIELVQGGVKEVADTEFVKTLDELQGKATDTRYHLMLVHLSCVHEEPPTVAARIKQLHKSKDARVVIWCDGTVKAAAENDLVMLNELKASWDRVQAGEFFDSRLSDATPKKMIDQLTKQLLS